MLLWLTEEFIKLQQLVNFQAGKLGARTLYEAETEAEKAMNKNRKVQMGKTRKKK